MTVTYHGHSCFRIRGKAGTVVFDPYTASVGWQPPSLSADVVISSHDHPDHNAVDSVRGTARREKPFVVTTAGEYEVGGISVFAVKTYHDDQQGVLRGSNLVSTVLFENVRITHLGDLGHILTSEQQEQIGSTDVLLVPVGGQFTLNPEQAVKVIRMLEPGIVIPMHYKTDRHDQNLFGELKTVQDFLKEYSVEVAPVPALEVQSERLPEETEVTVLTEQL